MYKVYGALRFIGFRVEGPVQEIFSKIGAPSGPQGSMGMIEGRQEPPEQCPREIFWSFPTWGF